ncbi:MAG: DNA polymerase, partial [Paenisporosarcina sp.]
IEQLLIYNGRDCAVEYEVDEEQELDLIQLADKYEVPLVEYYYNYMMKKHKFYLKMENNGFAVDMARKRELGKKYTELAIVPHSRITELVGHEVNVNSYPQMFMLLYKELKFKEMKRNPTSEDTIVALLGNHAKTKEKKEILTAILEERRIRTQKSRYINFSPDYDGRCKTSFNISSTETCRSSTGILNKPVRPKKIGLAFHTISKHGRLAKDIRSMFVPDKGTVFISADSSQAEARVVAVLSEDYELLEAFDKVDIHRRTAGMIFGYTKELILSAKQIPVVDIIEKDGPERFCGKKTRHAGNYDMGKGEFMVNFNTDAQKFDIDMSISEWRAGQMLDLFHVASPKIRGKFHKDIIDLLQSTRTIIDPFGGVRIFNGRMDSQLYKEGYANIPQRTVGHLVQGAALRIDDELNSDIAAMWLSENHDSLTMQVPENNWEPYARLMKKHLEYPIDFSTYCSLKRDYKLTIPCELEIAEKNYGEFRKVKI